MGWWGRSRPSKVSARVHTYKQLLVYAKEPKCLRCGYDIRTQLKEGYRECPECGQACTIHDLAQQISRQRYDRVPVTTDVFSGVMVLLALPLALVIANALVFFILAPFVEWYMGIISIGTSLVILGFILFAMYGSIREVCRAFGSIYGLWLWLAAHVYVAVYVASVASVTIWLGHLMAVAWVRWIDADAGPLEPIVPWGWTNVMGIAGIGVFLLNRWLATRFIMEPCRERCRVVATERLSDHVSRDLEAATS